MAAKVIEIEAGLTLVENGVEYQTEAGRIDLLARDIENSVVVIELKAGKAKDNALGQLLGYMGCLSASETTERGILVASNFDSRGRVVFAARRPQSQIVSTRAVRVAVSTLATAFATNQWRVWKWFNRKLNRLPVRVM